MNRTIEQLLEAHCIDLDKINQQRRLWLYASSIVFTGIIALIFTWDWLDHFHSSTLWWGIISLMLLLSINWWYWTMRVVKILLCHQQAAQELLKHLVEHIAEAREDIKQLAANTVDINK